ncbi:hypothetical protein FLL45_12765 [Aliikangiella marina]|uniref:Periplasmic heavy metal sensor n=1 Tax=Aliikangiella marina TaxID=1712262 RepID=A0A545T934_9GAMM|nr:Spy/CpxP family protein refolding chaperone [Aliikangiella marina]TQV73736.1 hypothetical protein FLL45_12765 [Aliikangiella marina]
MRKTLLTTVMLATLLAGATGSPIAVAQGSTDAELELFEHKMQRHHERKKFQIMRALSALDLSDDQKATIKSIRDSNQATAEANRETGKALRQQIRQALQEEVVDEAGVKVLVAQAAELRAEQMIRMAHVKKQILATLTDAQKVKLEKMKQRRIAKMKRWQEENEF